MNTPTQQQRSFDPVSGFLNRNAGFDAAARLLAEARQKQIPLSALWIDMDRFRQINHSFGHEGGDRLIGQIAGRIRHAVPASSEFIRVGGDEFVVLIPALGPLRVEEIARNMLFDIEQTITLDGVLIRLSASIGIALSQDGDDAGSLLERADRAMMGAKNQGGNRFLASGQEHRADIIGMRLAREELVIEGLLHGALEKGGLQLHYQPIVRLDGTIEAVEALMRCTGLQPPLMPGRFIPVAEKTGLIGRMGDWSLLESSRCAARLRDLEHGAKVAINVSRLQLIEPGFLPTLHGALVCADVPPELIELELTESLFMDVSPIVQANLHRVYEAGIGLAIDDFGTGFSSLSRLKDIPATKLKIDRSFVQALPHDPRNRVIVKAMTQLGQDLGMMVVAEGVETQDELDACHVAGVDATQGYLHARPMAEADLLVWMQARGQK